MSRLARILEPGSRLEFYRKINARRGFYLPLGLLTALGAGFVLQNRYLLESAAWVDRTEAIIGKANEVQKLIIDGETGLRGYALTHQTEFLEPFHSSEDFAPKAIIALNGLVAENQEQSDAVQEIEASYLTWKEWTTSVFNDGLPGKPRLDLVRGGKNRMDLLRSKITAFTENQKRLLITRRASEKFLAELILTSGLFFLFAVGMIVIWLIRKNIQLLDSKYSKTMERLREMIESAPQAVAMLDKQMRYTAVSARFVRDYGLDSDFVLGRTPSEVFPEVDDHWRGIHRRALAGEILGSEEEAFLRVDGRTQWLRWETRPWKDDQGQTGGILIYTEDITERREASEKLKQSENRLSDILDQTEAIVYIKDLQGRNVFANKALELMHGKSSELIRGKTDHKLFEKDIAQAFVLNDRQVLESKTSLKVEEQIKADNGASYFISNKFPLFDSEGNMYGLCGISTDITQQRRNQIAFETEKNKFESIFVDSPAAMAVLRGPAFVFEKINREYDNLIGNREVIGKTFLGALPELVGQPFSGFMEQVFKTGVPFMAKEMVAKLVRRPGGEPEETYFDFTYTQVKDGRGEPYGVYIHAVDVTERVQI